MDRPLRRSKHQDSSKILSERLSLYHQGLIDREIAEREGVSVYAIYRWRHKLGLPANNVHRHNGMNDLSFQQRQRVEQILQLRSRCMSYADIGKELGISHQAVQDFLKRHGMSLGGNVAPCDRVAHEIVERRQQGESCKQIAEALGFSPQGVTNWLTRNGFSTYIPPDLEQRRALYDQGLIDREIAEIQGVHRNSIANWRHRNNLPGNARPGRKRRIACL